LLLDAALSVRFSLFYMFITCFGYISDAFEVVMA
jgi:hypothetical protein